MTRSVGWLGRLKRLILGRTPIPRANQEAGAPAEALALQACGDDARTRGDWPTAATCYAQSLDLRPDNSALRVQLGHALKESGRLDEAEIEYRRARDQSPGDPEPGFQMGHALKLLGRPAEAIDAYVSTLRIDPGFKPARDELIAMGARDRLPEGSLDRTAAARSLARLSASLDQTLMEVRDWTVVSTFPLDAHDGFRRQYPVQPPPGPAQGPATVTIDACAATPAALRATLISLMDQRHTDWKAVVTGSTTLVGHPVASLARTDPRIRFVDDADRADRSANPMVRVKAGALLDREALGWLLFALARTGAQAVYCDHDHYELDWRAGPVRHSPVLQAMADRRELETVPSVPILAVFAPGVETAPTMRERLLAALRQGPVAHLPRLLASAPAVTVNDVVAAGVEPLPRSSAAARILVVVPTRDEAAMLERAVTTLRDQAHAPDLLDILVVDNRSDAPETEDALARMAAAGHVRTLAVDEPFNWSRCNNLAVPTSEASIVVFANNDVEALSPGWDRQLRVELSDPDVGVVGARLLYPDRSLQHGGILFGGWQGRPSHDGLRAIHDQAGPLDRWKRSRPAAAVTGAFMACRREVFEAVGGFEERFAIAYNDIDFCLKVRSRGLKVLYAADIELIHHESKTRGQNDSLEKVAWDDAELADMHARWDNWLFHDPGYNPQWASAANRPYDGLRDLPLSRVLEHLDASARPIPWAVDPPPRSGV